MNSDLVLYRHTSGQARDLADELGGLFAAAYAGTPQENDPFYSAERFAQRLHGYIKSPGFALVTARTGQNSDLIGYAFGYLLPPGARWWDGLLEAQSEDVITETGSRTFALNELHVRADHRGEGVASALHSELLSAAAPQERATVLVRPDNPARQQYEHWGYRKLGQLKPYPDSPTYLALLLQL